MSEPKKEEKHGGKDRHSGVTRDPKKGGAGGKGTWGRPGDELNSDSADFADEEYKEFSDVVYKVVDVDDPNITTLREFLRTGDIADFKQSIEEVKEHIQKDRLIKKAIQISMEHNAYERELTSKMISELFLDVFDRSDIWQGFQTVLDSVEDNVLDIPQAVDMVGKFIARSIADDVLPPSFLDTAICPSKQATDAVMLARGLIEAPHFGPRLAHVWGAGDLRSVKRLLAEVALIVGEYFINEDAVEAGDCIRRLNSLSFHSIFVEEALKISMEKTEAERKKVLDLALALEKQGVLSEDHIVRGFLCAKKNLPDISLDIPTAPQLLQQLFEDAKARGIVSASASLE